MPVPPRCGVRPATPDDVELILDLIRELAEYERAPRDAVATPDLIRRHLFGEGLGRGPTAECLIGVLDDAPAGFAVYFHNFSTWIGKPGMYLEDLFVRPQARGAGLGKALFAAVAREAVRRGCERMEWAVLDWNTPAIEFYERMGSRGLTEWTVHRLAGEALRKAACT